MVFNCVKSLFLFMFLLSWAHLFAFVIDPSLSVLQRSTIKPSTGTKAPTRTTTSLQDGSGIAQTYSWTEDALELEIRIPVPKATRAKDILFDMKPRSVSLKLRTTTSDGGGEGSEQVLLSGNRTLRGPIAMDGTFWNLEDSMDNTMTVSSTVEGTSSLPQESRYIVVTIEKHIRPPKDDFEIVDFDWGGVYPDDDAEVLKRTYLEPEEMDLKEYAASLGVDLDNINMSLVDKTMFTSGLNLTQSTLQELERKGLAKEVTQQSDGSEYIVDDDGESVPYSSYGADISREEVEAALTTKSTIPFLDTTSPWTTNRRQNLNIEEMIKDIVPPSSSSTTFGNVDAPHRGAHRSNEQESEKGDDGRVMMNDPIGSLTVSRLKQILREQGLKVTGNKEELQQRLRDHVQSQLN